MNINQVDNLTFIVCKFGFTVIYVFWKKMMLKFKDLNDNVIQVLKKYGDYVPVGDIYRYAPGYHDTRFVASKHFTSLSLEEVQQIAYVMGSRGVYGNDREG